MLLKNWARLYSNNTPAEVLLEKEICLLGMRYRSQHPIWQLGCIVDFALLDARIIIEVDGKSHNSHLAIKKDQIRDLKLKRLGWDVVRVRNESVFSDAADALVTALSTPLPSLQELESQVVLPQVDTAVGAKRKGRVKVSRRVKARAAGSV